MFIFHFLENKKYILKDIGTSRIYFQIFCELNCIVEEIAVE